MNKKNKFNIKTCILKWLHKNYSFLLIVRRDKINI